jgi:large repetitive protein
MESMHGEGGEGSGEGTGIAFRNSVRISTPDYCRDALTMMTTSACANRSRMTGLVSLNGWKAEDGTGDGSGAVGPAANAGSGSGAGGPWTIWAGGAIRFGDRDANSGRERQEFESEGITIGADYRFSASFGAGLGVGLGRDTVDVGDNGSQSRGEAKTIALYGSLLPAKGWFIDGLIGYQKLNFDLTRYVTPTGSLVNSSRDGDQWFATLSAGTDIETGNWQLTPYARFDMTRATLKGYAENSGAVFDLTFLDQDVNFTSLGLGTRIKYSHRTGWGYLLPQLRAEYQWDVERNADARVTYNDLVANPFSVIPLTGIGREELTLGAKLEAMIGSDLGLALEYLGRFSQGNGSDGTVQVGMEWQKPELPSSCTVSLRADGHVLCSVSARNVSRADRQYQIRNNNYVPILRSPDHFRPKRRGAWIGQCTAWGFAGRKDFGRKEAQAGRCLKSPYLAGPRPARLFWEGQYVSPHKRQ